MKDNPIGPIAFKIALAYWVPATMIFYFIISGNGIHFPIWLENLLAPGYYLGIVLAFVGGKVLGWIGQLFTFYLLYQIIRFIIHLFGFIK